MGENRSQPIKSDSFLILAYDIFMKQEVCDCINVECTNHKLTFETLRMFVNVYRGHEMNQVLTEEGSY